MQSEELIEKAIDKAVSALIDEHPMGHWRGDQVKEVARRAIAEAALSAAEPQPAPSVAVKALQAVRDELRVDTSSGSPGSISYEVGALHRIVAAVDAALSAQVQDVAGWQPIETAPKDGTPVILWTVWVGDEISPDPFSEVQIGYWDHGNDLPESHDFSRRPEWVVQRIGEPTHWMPLPAAPAKQEGVTNE